MESHLTDILKISLAIVLGGLVLGLLGAMSGCEVTHRHEHYHQRRER